MRSRLTRIVIPVLGLLAVTAALGLVGTAPLVLFPSSKGAGPRPEPPSASSQVGTVTASPPWRGPSSGEAGPLQPQSPLESGRTPAGLESPGFSVGPTTPDKSGGGVSRPSTGPGTEQPGEGDGDEGEQPGEGKGHKDKGHKGKSHKDKDHKGKAKGHSKDKAHGEAKGHGKWQGRTDVAFAPRGAKPSHVRSSGAGKHARRSSRSHARPRR